MPGFFDTYEDAGGLSWVGSAEKAELAAGAVVLPVKRVFSNTSQFGERFVLETTIDGEDRALGFGKGTVQSRDGMFSAIITYMEGEDAEPVNLVLKKVKQSYILVNADE